MARPTAAMIRTEMLSAAGNFSATGTPSACTISNRRLTVEEIHTEHELRQTDNLEDVPCAKQSTVSAWHRH